MDYEKLKLGTVDEDGKSVLISDSADRPNAFNSYSASKKSARDVKEMFDAPFKLVVKKFNDLIAALKEKHEAQDRMLNEFEKADTERREAEALRAAAEMDRKAAEDIRQAERAEFKTEVTERLNEQDERLSMLANESGRVVLAASGWSGEREQVITISNLGEHDLVMFYPEGAHDREVCGVYGIFVEPESDGSSFKVTANAKPLVNVSLKYYIIRGSLPEISEVE